MLPNLGVSQDNIVYNYLRRSTRTKTDTMMEQLAEQLEGTDLGIPVQITEHLSVVVANETVNFWLARLVGSALAVMLVIQALDPDIWQGTDTFRSDWLAFNGDDSANPKSVASHLCGEYSGVCFSPIVCSIVLQGAYGLFMQRLHWDAKVSELRPASRAWIAIEQILSCGLTLACFTMFKEFANYVHTRVALGGESSD